MLDFAQILARQGRHAKADARYDEALQAAQRAAALRRWMLRAKTAASADEILVDA